MIRPRNEYPLIYDAERRLAVLRPAWLRAAVEAAAHNSGADQCWLAQEIAAAVCVYLRDVYLHPVISLLSLESVVRRTALAIGLPELADRIRLLHPAQCLSLVQVGGGLPLRDEAEFFRRLRDAILGCHRSGVHQIDLQDLSACEGWLFSLQGAFPWQRSGDLRAKIVAFVRRQIGQLAWPQPFECSIT